MHSTLAKLMAATWAVWSSVVCVMFPFKNTTDVSLHLPTLSFLHLPPRLDDLGTRPILAIASLEVLFIRAGALPGPSRGVGAGCTDIRQRAACQLHRPSQRASDSERQEDAEVPRLHESGGAVRALGMLRRRDCCRRGGGACADGERASERAGADQAASKRRGRGAGRG
jgi:hypothetical protein